jgi:hypothetical protein
MEKFKLINEFYENDSIEIEVADDQDPAHVALEQLGWTIVAAKDVDNTTEQ